MKNTVARDGDILFFLCLNDRGGAEISMIRLAQGLMASGRRVTIAAYGSVPGLARELGFTGATVDLGCKRTAAAIWRLWLLLRRECFSTLISALVHTNIAAIIAARLALRPLRVIVTEHGIEGVELCAASPLVAFLTRAAYARADSIVTVSRGLEQGWRKILPPRAPVVAIYNPVVEDTASAPPPAHPWLARKEIPVVIGIGRLKEEKNFSLLVRSFARVAKDRDARLIILGEGEQRPLLEKLAKEVGLGDKILMPGFVADPRGWLAYAALLVCPSNKEGFGNVIAEALACGVPVVACDCPYGPAEILEQGRYGRLVPRGDEEAMARAIVETLDEDADKEVLRARAADFTVARCIDAYKGLIDN